MTHTLLIFNTQILLNSAGFCEHILHFHAQDSFSGRDCFLGALPNCLRLAPFRRSFWCIHISFLTFSDFLLFCTKYHTYHFHRSSRREEAHRSSRMSCKCPVTRFISLLLECSLKAEPVACLMCIAYHSTWHIVETQIIYVKWNNIYMSAAAKHSCLERSAMFLPNYFN